MPPAAVPFLPVSACLTAVSPIGAPRTRDSFTAVSSTSGSSVRGLGGRMRIVGALTDSTATTWPEASRTGAATVAAPAITSSVVSR